MRRLFEDSNLLCRHAGRVTVFPNDMEACLHVPEKEMLSPRHVSGSCKRFSGPTMLADGGTRAREEGPADSEKAPSNGRPVFALR